MNFCKVGLGTLICGSILFGLGCEKSTGPTLVPGADIPITISAPKITDTLVVGQTVAIKWKWTAEYVNSTFRIRIASSNKKVFSDLVASVSKPATGDSASYDWTPTEAQIGDPCFIQITDAGLTSGVGGISSPFVVFPTNAKANAIASGLYVWKPDTGVIVKVGDTVTIMWSWADASTFIQMRLKFAKGGARGVFDDITLTPMYKNGFGTASYKWIVESKHSGDSCRVRVSDYDDTPGKMMRSGYFKVLP